MTELARPRRRWRWPLPAALAAAVRRPRAHADRVNVARRVPDRGGGARPRARRARPARRSRCAAPGTPSTRPAGSFLARDRRRRAAQRARLAALPARRRPELLPARARRAHRYYVALQLFWAALLGRAAGRQPRARVAAGRGHDRRLGAARRLQRQAQCARGGLEVPRADDPRAGGRAARDRRPLRRAGRGERPRCTRSTGARSAPPRRGWPPRRRSLALRADPRRAGDEDRLGPGAQLAARRAQRGAAAGQRAALRGAAADRPARRLARPSSALGAGDRRAAPPARCSSASGSRRCRRRPVPLAAAAAEAPARLLEPRAHGRPRARDRLRHAARDRRRVVHVAGHALAKSLGFYAATAAAAPRPGAAHRAPPGVARQPATAAAMGVSLARSPACRPRRCSSASC